ncbi:D-Ala-D-Ala carboxypeptidase family metallohydrolase [Endozoicomonas atrinae]|uniref:D-Ala-D-Ala carboxypeptidase family metallohydrolase n=1 Tax=Endozoicomonas atrinae TaxID=1333660 RepID=UPI0009F58EA9
MGRLTKHFTRKELECRCGCGTCYVSPQALSKLETLRRLARRPIFINSACRCPAHNARVGGAPLSQHRSTKNRPATAFDISLRNFHKGELIRLAIQAGFKGIGQNYKTFVHVDDRHYYARW